MSKRTRMFRHGNGFRARYRLTTDPPDPFSRTTIQEFANRFIAEGAVGSLEVFNGENSAGRRQNLYLFGMVEPTDTDDLLYNFCSAVATLISRGVLRPGSALLPFLREDGAPPSNTGRTSTKPPPSAGEEGPTVIILPESLDGQHLN